MKILSLDGGGVFGVGQADILSKVTSHSKWQAVIGTSIGAAIGATIASGDSARIRGLSAFIDKAMPTIFAGYIWRRYNPFTPKYPDTNLNSELRAWCPGFFRDLKLPMFVPVLDLNNRALKVYFSGDPNDGAIPMWEVVRQAVAAETYFLPVNGYADAGVLANDPILVGVAGVQAVMGICPETMEVCSIGTGHTSYNSSIGSTRGWTLLGWGEYLITALLRGASNSMQSYIAGQLALKRYLRLQFIRDNAWDMDDPSMVNVARTAWAKDIAKAIPQVEAF